MEVIFEHEAENLKTAVEFAVKSGADLSVANLCGTGVKMNEELVECPFCGEKGFDLVGLKLHLTVSGWCNVFDSINVLNQFVPRNEMKEVL